MADSELIGIERKQSLSTLLPELASQWHPTKNVSTKKGAADSQLLYPSQFAIDSSEIVWWQCQEKPNHVWRASIESRAIRGASCPLCEGRRGTPISTLAEKYPELAKLWHPNRNLPLKTDQVLPGSYKMVWWQCQKIANHVWQAPLSSVVRKHKLGSTVCPYCTGHEIKSDNNLLAKHPAIAKLWHESRNSPLLPKDVSCDSNKVVWWQCETSSDHVWQSRVYNIVRSKSDTHGCPFCRGLSVCLSNCLATLYPEVAEFWHPLDNLKLTPFEITPGSNKLVWWKCPNSKAHQWKATICSVVNRYKRGSQICLSCTNQGQLGGFPLYVG